MMNNELIKGTHVYTEEIGHGEMSLVVVVRSSTRITRHKICTEFSFQMASTSTDKREKDNNEKCFIVWKKAKNLTEKYKFNVTGKH
jgi:hypothetical protein